MVAVPADISAHDMYGPESPQKHGTAPVFVRWVLPAAPLPAPLSGRAEGRGDGRRAGAAPTCGTAPGACTAYCGLVLLRAALLLLQKSAAAWCFRVRLALAARADG